MQKERKKERKKEGKKERTKEGKRKKEYHNSKRVITSTERFCPFLKRS